MPSRRRFAMGLGFALGIALHALADERRCALAGDVNADGRVNIADAVSLLDRLFRPGRSLACAWWPAEDLNGDGAADVADAIWLLSYLFQSGPPPADGMSLERTNASIDATTILQSAGPLTMPSTQHLTVEAFVRPEGRVQSLNCVIACGMRAHESFYFGMGWNGEIKGGIAGLDARISAFIGEFTSPPVATEAHTWYHIAMTYDGERVRQYLNADLVYEVEAWGTVPQPTRPIVVGMYYGDVPGWRFRGRISEIRIWNRALSQAELCAGMDAHPAPADPFLMAEECGLVAWWIFDDDALSFRDATGNGNDLHRVE